MPGSQYESTAPSNVTDRECAYLTSNCQVGKEYEHQSPSATDDRVCRPLTDCALLNTSKAPPATTMPDGNDTDTGGSTEPVLFYESTAPTGTSDRVCTRVTPKDCNNHPFDPIVKYDTSV